MGGVGVGSHVSKLGTFFLMSLTLRMPILGKKSHWTRAGECRKVFIAIFTSIEVVIFFETFHRSCPMIFFAENWHTYVMSRT